MRDDYLCFVQNCWLKGGDKLWRTGNFVALNADIRGRWFRVLQDRQYVLGAKVPTSIEPKRIEAMLVEAAEEVAGAVLVDLQQNRSYEDASGTKTRHGI